MLTSSMLVFLSSGKVKKQIKNSQFSSTQLLVTSQTVIVPQLLSDDGMHKTALGILDVTLLLHKQNKTSNQTKRAHENEATKTQTRIAADSNIHQSYVMGESTGYKERNSG